MGRWRGRERSRRCGGRGHPAPDRGSRPDLTHVGGMRRVRRLGSVRRLWSVRRLGSVRTLRSSGEWIRELAGGFGGRRWWSRSRVLVVKRLLGIGNKVDGLLRHGVVAVSSPLSRCRGQGWQGWRQVPRRRVTRRTGSSVTRVGSTIRCFSIRIPVTGFRRWRGRCAERVHVGERGRL